MRRNKMLISTILLASVATTSATDTSQVRIKIENTASTDSLDRRKKRKKKKSNNKFGNKYFK